MRELSIGQIVERMWRPIVNEWLFILIMRWTWIKCYTLNSCCSVRFLWILQILDYGVHCSSLFDARVGECTTLMRFDVIWFSILRTSTERFKFTIARAEPLLLLLLLLTLLRSLRMRMSIWRVLLLCFLLSYRSITPAFWLPILFFIVNIKVAIYCYFRCLGALWLYARACRRVCPKMSFQLKSNKIYAINSMFISA